MKKKLKEQSNEVEPQFEDASYMQDLRVDPLTTRDAIRLELKEIEALQEARRAEKLRLAKEQEEAIKKEFEEFKAGRSTAEVKEDEAEE